MASSIQTTRSVINRETSNETVQGYQSGGINYISGKEYVQIRLRGKAGIGDIA